MKIRAAVFDLDGTLLNERKEISPANRRAIGQLQASGVKILFATGRNAVYVQGLAADLGGVEVIIACNGALIRRVADGRTLYHRLLRPELVQELASYGFLHGLDFTASVDGAMFCTEASERVQVFIDYNKTMPVPYQIPLRTMRSPLDLAAQQVLKMFVWKLPADLEGDFRSQFGTLSDIELITSEKDGLDIGSVGVDKGTALESFADMYQIPLSEIAAFGDHENDIQMLDKAGYSVAMGNALPRVKRHARFCTKDHRKDGVAWAIEEYLLC